MKKILIVEDDVNIHNLLKEILHNNNYIVISAYSGTEALMVIDKENVDLILLDLMLPGINGEELIKRVSNIPIIVISAKISTEDKVNILSSGANDYITKPFDNDELLARVEVQLRLKKVMPNDNILEYKELKLDLESRILFINKERVRLTKTEFAILKQLLLMPNQALSKNKILDLIIYDTDDCDENSLKVHISNIRKKIGAYSSIEYIESVYGIGFKIAD